MDKYYSIIDIQKAMMVSKQTAYNWFKQYLKGITYSYKSRIIIPERYLLDVIDGKVENINPKYKLKALKILIDNGELKPIEYN